MKIFVSSLISGMEAERAAVRHAIDILGHEAVMAEDFGARASSPQVACLRELRGADVVVLLLGARYGAKQASGLSATHQEYRAARANKPILSFVQDERADMDADAEQIALIKETGAWEGGLYRDGFSTPEDLHEKVVRALHRHALAHAAAPLDPSSLALRVKALTPGPTRGYHSSGSALHVAIAAGPETSVLRPAELEAPALRQAIQQQTMFGAHPIFDITHGADSDLRSDTLVVFQRRDHTVHAEVQLWPTGDIRLLLPLNESRGGGFSAVIEEEVAERTAAALGFTGWLLDYIDSTQRISHVALCAAVSGQTAMGWRTRSEHAASPNGGSFSAFGREEERECPVMLRPAHRPRASLVMDKQRITEDLVTLLRRRWKTADH